MLQLLTQRRSSRNRNLQRPKLIGNLGGFGDEQVDWGHGEEVRDAVFLVVVEEFREGEARHPVDGATHVERIDEVPLDAGDVGDGKVGEGAIFEVRVPVGDPAFEHVAGDDGFGDEVAVGEFDAWGELLAQVRS